MRGFACTAVTFGALIACLTPILARPASADDKVKFSEQGRYESKTTRGFNQSETDTVAVSTWHFECEIPLGPFDPASLNDKTPVHIDVGDASYKGALGDDPAYHSGVTHVRLAVRGNAVRSDRKTDLEIVELRWDGGRLRVRVDGKYGSGTPMTSRITMAGKASVDEGVVNAYVELGDHNPLLREYEIPYKGHSSTRRVDLDTLSGEATTINLKQSGEAREKAAKE